MELTTSYFNDTLASHREIHWLPPLFTMNEQMAMIELNIAHRGNELIWAEGHIGGTKEVFSEFVKGRALGRSEEISPSQQAEIRASKMWYNKHKLGWVTNTSRAKCGDTGIDGIEPMTPSIFKRGKNTRVYPAIAQPKVDGYKAVAVYKYGRLNLYNINHQRITSVPHIRTQILDMFGTNEVILDGELCSPDYTKDGFGSISTLIRRKGPIPRSAEVEFWIYDTIAPGSWVERNSRTIDIVTANAGNSPKIKMAPFVEVKSEVELESYFRSALSDGFEGAIYRNPGSSYEHRKTTTVQNILVF